MVLSAAVVQEAPRLAVIVPAYNEAAGLEATVATLLGLLRHWREEGRIAPGSFVGLVDDGSNDATWAIIEELCACQPGVRGLKLSRNFGHQAALWAGLTTWLQEAEALVTIDADLQDDPQRMADMVEAFGRGYDVVLGVRTDRASDTPFKRATATAFYALMARLGVRLVPNHADFRLLSRRAATALLAHREASLFLRALVMEIGFPCTQVTYPRRPRLAGTTKYPLLKMLAFAWDGITGFSVVPLRLISLLGFAVMLVSLGLLLYTLVVWALGQTVWGWSSLMLTICLLGGAQLLALGIIGEYLGKVFRQAKGRPIFLVEAWRDGQTD